MTTPIVYRPSELPPVYPTCLLDCTFALDIKTLLFAQNSCVWTLNHSFQAVTSSKPIGLVTIYIYPGNRTVICSDPSLLKPCQEND